MHRTLTVLGWASLYSILVVGPLVLMLIGGAPRARGFWIEFSMALGFLGLAQLVVQFVLIARFKRVTAPYGIDAIMYYHRQVGTLAVLVILAHPVVLVIHEPAMLSLLNPAGGNWASRTGVWSAIALVLLVLLSNFRRPLRLSYERWRIGHAVLAMVAAGLAVAHVALIGPYVTAGWKFAFWTVFVALGMTALAYPRLILPLCEKRRPFRVVEVRPEAERVWTLVVEPVGHEGLRFEPGQFAWVKMESPFSIDEHPFSFSSSSELTERLEFGIKEVGDFTRTLPAVQPGARVYLDGPHGAFSIDRVPSAGYVFVAGGIGIVPILSMLRTMIDRGDRRPARLIYAVRSLENLAYRDDLEALRLRAPTQLDLVYVLEQPPEGWTGETGWITRELLEKHWPRERITRDVLICGPDPMITSVDSAFRHMGVPAARLHAERFDLV
ncbi:MAG: ferric reductase-like transmembrane domain-containing protein [Phycisphaerales bacterium]|nr:ferric reductase-like transmembrane domain-containing protein [Phycisphaerales bacterium]